MPLIRVLDAGLLTTVQDLGRLGYADLGVPVSGAADAFSLRLGNLLVGNSENAAALEMTLLGAAMEFDGVALVALTGSDFGSTLDGDPVPNWVPFEVERGQTIRCGASRAGARCYLCVHGGIDVPLVLGSASTHLLTAMGGLEGRALRAGDALCVGPPVPPHVIIRQVHPQRAAAYLRRDVLRVTEGPQFNWFPPATCASFFQTPYLVSEDSDRTGLLLRGAPLPLSQSREMLVEGVAQGALEISPDTQPLLVTVDHQTTGVCPKIANVISADLSRAGQLRPQDSVRFELVSLEAAQSAARQQEEWIYSLVQLQ